MDPIFVLFGVFAVFIPALLLPGPDFVAIVRVSMTRGPLAGLLTTLGVSAGLGFYATLSLLGLSAVLSEYQWLAWTIRVLGGCYLAYLGVRLLLAKPGKMDLSDDQAPRRTNALVFGFLVTLTNPKAIVLFASVFAPVVSADTPTWFLSTMIGLVIVSALTWYTLVSLCMSSAPVIRRFQHVQHWIERVAGICFIGIGARIMADARNPVSP